MRKSTPSTTPETTVRAPKGFRNLGSVTADCWFALKPGNVIQGKLLGCYSRDDKRTKSGKSEFFQIVLTEPCECRYGRGEKVSFKMAPVGSTVNLNCNTKTEVLKDLIPDLMRGAEYEVWVHCIKKITLQNGNTMWDIMPSANQLVAPKAVESPDFGGDGEDEGEGEGNVGDDSDAA
jgi:hypothetical protein